MSLLNDFNHDRSDLLVKFIYSEKATIFSEISTLDLSYVVMVKSKVEISQNFVAFSEYMNFTSYERAGFFTEMKQKKVQNGRLKKLKMAASKKPRFPAPPILNIFS